MYTNPHFPTALALVLFSFIWLMDPGTRFREVKLLLAGLLTGVILPFGLVVAVLVGLAQTAWTWLETRRLEWQPIFCLGLLGGLVALYDVWVVRVNPALANWNLQNQTPSPPLWDLLLAFSPALILAPFGAYQLFKERANPARKILIPWLVLAIVLVYSPFALQRRFLLGFYIPVAALAILALDTFRQKYGQRARFLAPAVFSLALPSNLLLILIQLMGAMAHSQFLYLQEDEARALAWIQAETPRRALVLAAPDMGGFVPAFTGRRVIYGHPFETTNAEQEEQRVRDFYSQKAKVAASMPLISDRQVDYIMYGPREKLLGGSLDFSTLRLVYEAGAVQIYAVQGAP
jgi:hypothetical protein